jgi:hypothetical protein
MGQAVHGSPHRNPRFLERRAAGDGGNRGVILTDLTAHIRREVPRASRARRRGGGGREELGRRRNAARADVSGQHHRRGGTVGIDEGVAALRRCRYERGAQICRDEGDGTGDRRCGQTSSSRADIVASAAAARRKRRLRTADGPNGSDGRCLVTRHARAQQSRHGDGGDDADNGHDDQQFDQREPFLFTNPHCDAPLSSLGRSAWPPGIPRAPVALRGPRIATAVPEALPAQIYRINATYSTSYRDDMRQCL